mmetsp:Transcript_3073/g.5198  ORF Transcript_3073/g.5198 Transcript_3073/m.5198 type:complete len:328 (+) Transcript_3073:173-1156(+)
MARSLSTARRAKAAKATPQREAKRKTLQKAKKDAVPAPVKGTAAKRASKKKGDVIVEKSYPVNLISEKKKPKSALAKKVLKPVTIKAIRSKKNAPLTLATGFSSPKAKAAKKQQPKTTPSAAKKKKPINAKAAAATSKEGKSTIVEPKQGKKQTSKKQVKETSAQTKPKGAKTVAKKGKTSHLVEKPKRTKTKGKEKKVSAKEAVKKAAQAKRSTARAALLAKKRKEKANGSTQAPSESSPNDLDRQMSEYWFSGGKGPDPKIADLDNDMSKYWQEAEARKSAAEALAKDTAESSAENSEEIPAEQQDNDGSLEKPVEEPVTAEGAV